MYLNNSPPYTTHSLPECPGTSLVVQFVNHLALVFHSCCTDYNYGTGPVLGLGTSAYYKFGRNKGFLSISGPIIIQNQDADYNGALIHSYRAYTLSLGAFLFTIISSSVALYGKPT